MLEHTQHTQEERPESGPTRQRSRSYADLVAATARFSWPPARAFMTVYAQDLMAVDIGMRRPVAPPLLFRLRHCINR